MDRKIDAYLNELLSLYWLRPETALWRALDCALMKGERPQGRGVDLGCGTGLLSYVMAGGHVRHYDSFMNVRNPVSSRLKTDFYDTRAAHTPSVNSSGLRYSFWYGIDHKKGLIDQAKQLRGFYKHTLLHDLNKPLSFADRHFDWAFSNVLYWLKNVSGVLREWNRVLKRSGRLYLFVPNHNFKDKAWLYYNAPHTGEQTYLNYFDRGYRSLIHHCYHRRRWETLFKGNGFRTLFHKPYLSTPVMEIWNIGTRPISPLLMDMASRLRAKEREAVKANWITFFRNFFLPVLRREITRPPKENDCAFHFFVLEKS